jgi:hypothetical protein
MNQHAIDMSRIETLVQRIFPSSSIQLEQVEEAIFTTVYRITRQKSVAENGGVFQLLLESVRKRRNWTLIGYYVAQLHGSMMRRKDESPA